MVERHFSEQRHLGHRLGQVVEFVMIQPKLKQLCAVSNVGWQLKDQVVADINAFEIDKSRETRRKPADVILCEVQIRESGKVADVFGNVLKLALSDAQVN